MQSHQFHIQRIGHVDLVAGMCKELGIAILLDCLVSNQSGNRNISFDETVVSMLINGLGFNARTLHMFPEFHADKPLDKLIRPGIKPEHINDSVLSRAPDQLFELGGPEDSAALKSPMTDTHHNDTTKIRCFLTIQKTSTLSWSSVKPGNYFQTIGKNINE